MTKINRDRRTATAPMRRPRKITFLVTDAPNNGFVARAVGHDIFTDADDWDALPARIRDAVRCHFGDGPRTAIVCYSGRNGSQTLMLPLDAKSARRETQP